MEGIPTLVVVTKEGKLLTDEGDEQVSVRLIAIFSRLVLNERNTVGQLAS